MRILDLNTGYFLSNINYIYINNINKNITHQDIKILLNHLKKDTLIISMFTTYNNKMYHRKMLPLEILNDNYEIKIN